MPSNFKSYEAQSRLLVAVIAANPELKLNFKAIRKYYGSDTTESGLEHRFRPLKKHALGVRDAVDKGTDAVVFKDVVSSPLKEQDIAKFYGESSPAGIEFQFRTIKQSAKAVRAAVDAGESPLKATPATTPKSGTKRKTPASTPATKTSKSGAASSTAKRAKKENAGTNGSASADSPVDYEALDVTPTKPKPAPSQPEYYGAGPAADAAASGAGTGTPGMTTEATPSEEDFGASFVPSQYGADVSFTGPAQKTHEPMGIYGMGDEGYEGDGYADHFHSYGEV